MLPTPDTIAALATPPGISAIAVVRVSGPQAAGIAHDLFGANPSPRQMQRADYRRKDGSLVDDVLFVFFAGPNSYTGEDTMEISCHGNPLVARLVLEDLYARGCRPAEPGEFTQRAFLNGRMDLSQAEAVMDLIHAQSEQALEAANRQLRGALKKEIDSINSLLIKSLANIEAYIDFPEEDLPPEQKQMVETWISAGLAKVGRLLATARYGEVLRTGFKVVIIGEPNAGKSSLLNRLLGRDRAIVSPEPGTTRDYLEERIRLGAHGFRLVDTAGLNGAPSGLERRGISKTMEQAEDADLYLWVMDATRPVPTLPSSLVERFTPENTIAVFNKEDLLGARLTAALPYTSTFVSALTGAGISQLEDILVQKVAKIVPAGNDEPIAINARHAVALRDATEGLTLALDNLKNGGYKELVSSDVRSALGALNSIGGKIEHERVLDEIFSSFCIGK